MESVVPGLYASTPRPLPFAPSLTMRSYLCRREDGNLLVYGSGELDEDAAEIENLGGASRTYLNHGHEAEFLPVAASDEIFLHEGDREAVAARAGQVSTFSDRHLVGDDFEAIPTPGHTPGATAYLWSGPQHRVLFTGDTLYLSDDEWAAAVLESSDREGYVASLELLRELEFDLLVPWIAGRRGPAQAATDPADARRRIDAILERIRPV